MVRSGPSLKVSVRPTSEIVKVRVRPNCPGQGQAAYSKVKAINFNFFISRKNHY